MEPLMMCDVIYDIVVLTLETHIGITVPQMISEGVFVVHLCAAYSGSRKLIRGATASDLTVNVQQLTDAAVKQVHFSDGLGAPTSLVAGASGIGKGTAAARDTQAFSLYKRIPQILRFT